MCPLDLTCGELDMLRDVLHAARREFGHPGADRAIEDEHAEAVALSEARRIPLSRALGAVRAARALYAAGFSL